MATLALALAFVGRARAGDERRLDGFETLNPWSVTASEDVKAAIGPATGPDGRALELRYDFGAVSGYAVAARPLALTLPENWALRFRLRSNAPSNAVQVKLTDAAGENVWWHVYPAGTLPTTWTQVTLHRRDLSFAWGPIADKTLHRADRIEFVAVKGLGGAAGSLAIANLSLETLPPEPTMPTAPTILDATDGKAPTVDLGGVRSFGGLRLRWRPGARPSGYTVSLSDDGETWRFASRLVDAGGTGDVLRLPEAEARYIRFDAFIPQHPPAVLDSVDVEPLEFGATLNAFVEAAAKQVRRGLFPRGFSGEQPYWTLVGIDGGGESALISEDGAIELNRGGASIEPFVIDDSGLVTWADVEPTQSLRSGYLPIPTVEWRRPSWSMRVTAVAVGSPDRSRLYGRYELTNRTDRALKLRLALVVRPFQVNGPRQFLGVSGGVSEIHHLDLTGSSVVVDGRQRLLPIQRPTRAVASSFNAGNDPETLLSAERGPLVVDDATGLASGALVYDLVLGPHARRILGWGSALGNEPADLTSRDVARGFEEAVPEAVSAWSSKLNAVTFIATPAGRTLSDVTKTALAHILMSRRGAALQPGARSYDRSWIRDGAMMAEGLDRMGQAGVSADYLRWYAPHQFANGKVPCCVDARGADPTPENDSQGEMLFLAAETYRYTGDKTLLRAVWPEVRRAVDRMDGLRLSERTAANETPARRMLHGLMPPSISHEGYSSKPAYSYWDDHWALRGYHDAVFIARALGEDRAAQRFQASRDAFHVDLRASITEAARIHGEPLLFGAADLGDFDPTSTTIALEPGDEQDELPPALLTGTFDRYWREFVERRDGRRAWSDYTPYELRNAGVFIRLGERDRAWALMTWFLADRRPLNWNGWAEVVGHNAREPRFVGDMPHAWIASDLIRSALDMFAYDLPGKGMLVLGAGLPADWFASRSGVGVLGLRTPYGVLDWRARAAGQVMVIRIGGAAAPPAGFDLPWPFVGTPGATTFKGKPVVWQGRTLHLAGSGKIIVHF